MSTSLPDFKAHQTQLDGTIWRIVETQEIAATREITHSAKEQSRLEELLEQSKPLLPVDCHGLSYLLFTPFRYPPLDYGSRFGSSLERGIFYGAQEIQTALAEAAVYLWLFQSGLKDLGPLAQINDQRTAFSVEVNSNHAIDLSQDHFSPLQKKMCAPADWSLSQEIGRKMRSSDIDVFWYPSARVKNGMNAGIFNPAALSNPEPLEQQHWHLRLNTNTCWFGRGRESLEFSRNMFEEKGEIPHPHL